MQVLRLRERNCKTRDSNSVCSTFPKNAVNFHMMKKGLYYNSNIRKRDYINFVKNQQPFMKAYFSAKENSEVES